MTLTDVCIDGVEIQTDVRLTTYQSKFLKMPRYARVSARGLLKAPENLLYGFDREYYLFSRGVSLVADMTDGRFEENPDPPFFAAAEGLQKTI